MTTDKEFYEREHKVEYKPKQFIEVKTARGRKVLIDMSRIDSVSYAGDEDILIRVNGATIIVKSDYDWLKSIVAKNCIVHKQIDDQSIPHTPSQQAN